jgi:hypothetical protein
MQIRYKAVVSAYLDSTSAACTNLPALATLMPLAAALALPDCHSTALTEGLYTGLLLLLLLLLSQRAAGCCALSLSLS